MATPSPIQEAPHGLTRWELLFLAGAVAASALYAVWLGKSSGWDFRNYHWYDAYAFLNGRLGYDLAVAHHATYYNPLLDVPFFVLATAGTSWFAILVLGAVQGLNIVPLYLMARSALVQPIPLPGKAAPAVLALLCATGSTAVSMVGKTTYDNVASVLVLSGLAAIVIHRDALAREERGFWPAALGAGMLLGMALGFKLVEAPFAVGGAAAMLALGGRLPVQAKRLLALALGGLAGALLTGGYWHFTLWQETGNPIFPYFNHIIGSPLATEGSYRDARFIPPTLLDALSVPFRYLIDYRVSDDGAFRDIRITIAYVLVPLAALLWAAGARARDSFTEAQCTRVLFAFAGVSYVAWLSIFGIYRYMIALEMLAPLLILAACALLPLRLSFRLGLALFLIIGSAFAGRYELEGRLPLSDPYIRVEGARLVPRADAMILMTGKEPMAFMIPDLAPSSPVLRIDGWLASPADGSGLTQRMRARVAAHQGPLLVLFAPYEAPAAAKATAAYGLAIEEDACDTITTNLGGPYRLCPLSTPRATP